ncbi:MAG TPA: efflux RND transporter periplasmic adaptor subunit [Bacteroidales bacterium]
MKKYFNTSTLFLATVIVLYSCGNTGGGKDKEEDEKGKEQAAKDSVGLRKNEVMLSFKQYDAVSIQTGSLQKQNLDEAVSANGYLAVPPQNKANVSVYIGGVVKSIVVTEGDHVNKGQSLAMLEHPDYIQLQQDYLSTHNNFVLAEKEYLRQKELYSTNATAEKNFQKAENDYNAVKISLASLAEKLKLIGIDAEKIDYNTLNSGIVLKSPIDGYVIAIHATIGKFIDPSTVMFEVVNTSNMNIVLQIFENDISKIRPGEHLSFTIPDESGFHSEGIVYAIDKIFDEVKKSFSVRAKVTGNINSQALLPGVYVNAAIETTNSPTTTLPDEAIVKEGQSEYVFILSRTKSIENQKYYVFEMKEVKTGTTVGGSTSVTLLEQVPDNIKFVTKGAYYIQSEKNKGETENVE